MGAVGVVLVIDERSERGEVRMRLDAAERERREEERGRRVVVVVVVGFALTRPRGGALDNERVVCA